MKIIYLIRHGKASLSGSTEEERPLEEEGFKQAKQLSTVLQKLEPKISKLYSSPYKRAIQSFEPFAQPNNLQIGIIDDLHEWEMSSGPVQNKDEARKKLWEDANFKLEGGESRKEAEERAIRALDGIIKEMHEGSAAAVMSHGTLVGIILKHFNPAFGFNDWKSMGMPDIFKIKFENENAQTEHIGCAGVDTFTIGQDKNLQINKEYLKEKQYKQSKYLEARIAIHKFGTGKESFHKWVWDKLGVNKPVKILDVGCGTAEFWKENYAGLPKGSALVLTDFSDGMVKKAKESISGDNITFEVADIDRLPYKDDSFDIVMAHHVVYHAENKDKALSELKRVVKNSGFVTITTNSEKHMINVYEIGRQLDKNFPCDRIIDSFTEKIANQMLPKFFKKLETFVSEELLKVDDMDILMDYIKSGVEPRNIVLRDGFFEDYRKIAQAEMDKNGFFGIMKRSPLYICRK